MNRSHDIEGEFYAFPSAQGGRNTPAFSGYRPQHKVYDNYQTSSGPLATGLHAWTSIFDLCIAQSEVAYPYNGPYLKVSPLPDGRVEFRYLDTQEKDKQWHRTVEANDTVPRLLKFFAQLRWFPSELLRP